MIRFAFAMYILMLAVYPCNDSQICLDEKKAGVSVSAATHHEHSSDERDQCTPFCFCACCATHMQVSYAFVISCEHPVHNTSLNTPYFERPLLNNIKSIWQPPKIS